LNTKALKVFFIYAAVKFLLTALLFVARYYSPSRETYLLVLRFDLVFEYLILSFFFWHLIRSVILRRVLLLSNIPFLAYCLYIYSQTDYATFNNGPTLIELLVFLIVIIFYFFERMRLSMAVPLYQTVNFWLSVGFFVYFSGVFFYILLVETYYLRSDARILAELKLISCSVVILKNLILSFALSVKEVAEGPEEYNFNIPLDMDLDSFETFTPKNNLN
jgi:hypothetical protein